MKVSGRTFLKSSNFLKKKREIRDAISKLFYKKISHKKILHLSAADNLQLFDVKTFV